MREYHFDKRRVLALPGDHEATLSHCVSHWIACANESIADHGFFAVALSGGSTPKKIYQKLGQEENTSRVDWSKVLLFWSDERSSPPDDPDSNFHMAIEEGGLGKLPIPKEHIFRMKAEANLEAHALEYEETIRSSLKGRPFDLIMLGMGEDGHTASLFPHTKALDVKGRLVVANHVPQKNTWRMTFTLELINAAHHICFYVLGPNKSQILSRVLTSDFEPHTYPSQSVGTPEHKAVWIIDDEASQHILSHLK